MQQLIPNALQPSEVDEVILCQMIGKAIVLVREDQLSLAIGRRGQNVRLASKLCGWDIEIMTREELDSEIERAVAGYSELDGVEPSLAERLVGEGFLTYDELSVIEPDALMSMGNLTEEQVQHIVDQAERTGGSGGSSGGCGTSPTARAGTDRCCNGRGRSKRSRIARASGGYTTPTARAAVSTAGGGASRKQSEANGGRGNERNETASTGEDSASGGAN